MWVWHVVVVLSLTAMFDMHMPLMLGHRTCQFVAQKSSHCFWFFAWGIEWIDSNTLNAWFWQCRFICYVFLSNGVCACCQVIVAHSEVPAKLRCVLTVRVLVRGYLFYCNGWRRVPPDRRWKWTCSDSHWKVRVRLNISTMQTQIFKIKDWCCIVFVACWLGYHG